MRLIDADALRDEVLHDSDYDNDTINHFLGVIDDTPGVDPVRRGRWAFQGDAKDVPFSYRCNLCGMTSKTQHWNFCPSCGAKMDKEEKPCEN